MALYRTKGPDNHLLSNIPMMTRCYSNIYYKTEQPGMVECTYNPSIWEAKAGELPGVRGQPALHEFKASLHCMARSCLRKTQKTEQTYF